MYGLNAGYDTRPMATGAADSGVSLFGTEKTVFFQQAAINLEAVSNTWNFNAYGLLPTGDKEQQINWLYSAGSLATYGFDVGYNITPDLTTSIGYYYQDGDGSEADGSGIIGRVDYEITYGLIAGVNVSYDEAFETRVSADLEYRFGGPSKTTDKKKVAETPVIKALFRSPSNRNVRIHDKITYDKDSAIELSRSCLAKLISQDPVHDFYNGVDRGISGYVYNSTANYKTVRVDAIGGGGETTLGAYISSLNWNNSQALMDLYETLSISILPESINVDKWTSCVEDGLSKPVKKIIKSDSKEKSMPKKDSDDTPVVVKG
jgi:hypothetical protein